MKWLQATYLPPVSQGDIAGLLRRRPRVIGIIDGYFERVPAVWHKEILLALSAGVHVVGGASMGALRAAELHSFGMVGVGEVFAWYRARYAQSAPFKLWGHRFAYDFLWPRARYFDALNIPYGHLHPFLDRRMLEFIFRVTPEQHCNVLVDYNSFYRGTKLLPRRAFRDVFPDYMYNRQSKTSYALMARKCVLNVRGPLLAMFAPDRRTNVAELGIIDQRRFREHLIATLIRAEDPNNDLGELYQYTRGIIDLEIWLRETQGCRQTVLERARPQRPRTLAETEMIGI